MKKLLTFCLLMTIAFSVNAQTKEETIEYLKAFYSSLPGIIPENSTINCDSAARSERPYIKVRFCATWKESCEKHTSNLIFLEDIRAISFESFPYKKLSENSYQNACWKLVIQSIDGKVELPMSPDKDKSYLEKFKKALTRLAVLSGAQFANEDLFGNYKI